MRRNCAAILLFSVLASSILLVGCSTAFEAAPTAVQSSLGTVQGKAMGGQQPVVGAAVYVYAATTAGYGAASTSLLTAYSSGSYPTTMDANGNYYVTTGAGGNFVLSGEYVCTPGTQVYLYVIGGNPGNGVNTAAGFLAVLGRCPASGTLADTVPTVIVNEVTTIAAAYALAGFASDGIDIGSSDNPPAAIAIANAFANAGQMVNIAASATGALAITPGGTGSVPQQELNTLADVLAACINSPGATSTACTTLFANATSTGTASGTLPTNTATAAINIAHHPLANVVELYSLVGATPPFLPKLSAAPDNFMVSLAFSGGGLGAAPGNAPHSIAIDDIGNVYTANAKTNTLIKLSPLGVFASPAGFTGNGLSTPTSVAIDITSAFVYLANSTGQSVSRFAVTGLALGKEQLGADVNDAEVDGSGNVWASSYVSPDLFRYTSTTTGLMTLTGNGMSGSVGLALSPGTTGNVWVTNSSAGDISAFTNAGGVITGSPFVSAHESVGVAIDVAGLIWLANTDGTVGVLTATGGTVPGSPYAVASSGLQGIAIDGDDRIWVSSSGAGKIYELGSVTRSGISASAYPALPAAGPDGVAIDCSGNVWYNTDTDATLRELIGAATPVITPIALGVASSLLATRP